MYLQNMMEQNPALLEKTIDFHRQGKIPPNTWVIDLDTIAQNGAVLSKEANRLGLTTYLMSKQHNRNPYINALALKKGIHKMVAVDVQGVLQLRKYGIPLGHAGHLNQIPRGLIELVVAQKPEVITIYNLEHAKWINDAASRLGVVQELLIRVNAPGDVFFNGQEGGFYLEEIPLLLEGLKKLDHVSLAGVTAFPCVKYNETKDDKMELTPNMQTVMEAAALLRTEGIEIKQINAPGNTSSRTMKLLKEHGATHVEPGNSLLGTTPDNAFDKNCPEKTAFCYVTEISHLYDRRAYAYGGGVYHCNYSDTMYGLVGSTWEEAKNNKIFYDHTVVQDIDYHMQLIPGEGQECRVGDSAVFAYRTQMHMTRSYVAPVSGLSGKRELKVHYLFDNANNAYDTEYNPVSPGTVCDDIRELLESY